MFEYYVQYYPPAKGRTCCVRVGNTKRSQQASEYLTCKVPVNLVHSVHCNTRAVSLTCRRQLYDTTVSCKLARRTIVLQKAWETTRVHDRRSACAMQAHATPAEERKSGHRRCNALTLQGVACSHESCLDILVHIKFCPCANIQRIGLQQHSDTDKVSFHHSQRACRS